MCKNAQYDKDVIKKRTEACLNFQVKMQGQNYVIVVGITKSKHSEELEGKLRLKLQVTHVCEFHFNITDINVSGDHHIKTLKHNVVPSLFTFIKKKSPESQPKQRSPRKRHLTVFVKPKPKKLTPEIIYGKITFQVIVFKINRVVLFVKTVRDFHLKICY